MTRIYLIRHAEAEGNKSRVFQGHSDGDISENGELQLERLRERCKRMHFDAVFSSPLLRAYKTAQAAAFNQKLPVTTLDGLKEIHGGSWEGCRWEDFPQLYPEQNRQWVHEPWSFVTEGGESMCAVYNRIWETIIGIVKENEGKSVCVVSHGCAIRNFLCRAQGRALEELNCVKWCDNTAISVIDFDEGLSSRVVLLNDATHLDAMTTTLGKQDWWKEFEPAPGE